MWTTKIIIPYRASALLSFYAKKHQVSIIGYPLSHQVKKDSIHISGASYVLGESKRILEFLKALKKDKRVLKLEAKNNFIFATIKQHLANKMLFQSDIFHYRPYMIDKGGNYIFEIAAWDKEPLSRIILSYQKHFQAKLMWLKKQKLNTVQTINVYPFLTEKQRKCLQLAIDHKYYDYPRRITLKELAILSKISYSTYQFHLQNAEKKVIPFLNSLI